MFSVVIPLYNKENHVKNSIETVLNQTCQDFEIVVIDDGSTDGGVEIVRQIPSEKIKLFQHDSNQGLSVARNTGIEKAKYDFIVLLDADDGILPEYLSEIKKLIEEFPEAGIYATNKYILKYSTKEYKPVIIDFLPERGIVQDYFYHVSIGRNILGCVSTIRKEVFSRVGGFAPGMIRGQDTHLLTRVMLSEKLCYLNKHLYYYTIGSENQATDSYKPSLTSKSLLDHLDSGVEYADESIIRYSLNQVGKLIKSGYKKEARNKLKKTLELCPSDLKYMIEERESEIEELMTTSNAYFLFRKKILKTGIKINDAIYLMRKRLKI